MATFDDGESNWNLMVCWYQVCVKEVTCEFEDGYYYYLFEDRLIYKEKYGIDSLNMRIAVEKYYRCGKNLYPEFISKEQKRDKKLKEILS